MFWDGITIPDQFCLVMFLFLPQEPLIANLRVVRDSVFHFHKEVSRLQYLFPVKTVIIPLWTVPNIIVLQMWKLMGLKLLKLLKDVIDKSKRLGDGISLSLLCMGIMMPTLEEVCGLMPTLEQMAVNIHIPWCVIGDFNNVQNLDDRLGVILYLWKRPRNSNSVLMLVDL